MHNTLSNYYHKILRDAHPLCPISDVEAILCLDIPANNQEYIIPVWEYNLIPKRYTFYPNSGLQVYIDLPQIPFHKSLIPKTFKSLLRKISYTRSLTKMQISDLEAYYVKQDLIIDKNYQILTFLAYHVSKEEQNNKFLVYYVDPSIFTKTDILGKNIVKHVIPFLAAQGIEVRITNLACFKRGLPKFNHDNRDQLLVERLHKYRFIITHDYDNAYQSMEQSNNFLNS